MPIESPQIRVRSQTNEAPRAENVAASELARLRWENQASAAILEIVGQVTQAEDLTAAGFALVSGLQKHLGADRVALGIVRGGKKCRLLAISGMAEFDRNSALVRSLEAALDEAAWSSESITPIDPRLRVGLVNAAGASAVTGVKLQTAGGTLVGAWVMVGEAAIIGRTETRGFALASSEPLSVALDVTRRAGKSTWARPIRKLFASRSVCATVIAIAALVCGIMALPWPYKIGCEAELQPVTRRFVQAPFAGLFEKSLVKPGDLVGQDQVLGRLDGRELRIEAAALEADANRAARSREANMAANKIAAAQMDKLEMDRLEMKRRLLVQRSAQLEIKSPLAGIVIAGDLEKSQGAPLTLGQSLYEIAPLDRMVVEVAIPVEEISHVREACDVTISLDAYPGQTWSARLLRVQPRAEVRETDNVFIAEVELDNASGQLRPGMKGRAKLVSDSRSIGWILLHKPWNRVMNWMGW